MNAINQKRRYKVKTLFGQLQRTNAHDDYMIVDGPNFDLLDWNHDSKQILLGVEPRIFGFEDQRLIH